MNNPRNNSWCFFCFEAADLNCSARLLLLEVFVIGKVGHWPHSCWSRLALKNTVTEAVAAKTTLLINTLASKLRMLFLFDNWHYCGHEQIFTIVQFCIFIDYEYGMVHLLRWIDIDDIRVPDIRIGSSDVTCPPKLGRALNVLWGRYSFCKIYGILFCNFFKSRSNSCMHLIVKRGHSEKMSCLKLFSKRLHLIRKV